MNEHDVAGLLEADGLTLAAVFCIRENADNKLAGLLGNLKTKRTTIQIFRSRWLDA